MDTLIKEKVGIQIEEELLTKLKEKYKEESQVIVHCMFKERSDFGTYIRIWPSTFLFDNQSPLKSKLVHVENICLFPKWQFIQSGSNFNFSLVFNGLPDSCLSFDMKEVIPQKGGFEVNNIKRNDTDVYFVNI